MRGRLLASAGLFSPRVSHLPTEDSLAQSLRVCAALLELVPIYVQWAALPAPEGEVEHPCEVQLAAVVSTWAVVRALPRICESAPRPTLSVSAESVSTFCAQ